MPIKPSRMNKPPRLYLFSQANWTWLLFLGIIFAILGIIAISLASTTTIISIIFLGVLILIGGVIIIADTFKTWWAKWSGFALHLVIGILYLYVGIVLISEPVASAVSITLLLGVFYIVVGAFRLIYSLGLRTLRWGYSFFNGIVTLLLGLLIVANWPAGSLFIIGLLIGIDLLVSGITYIMISLSAKRIISR